MPGFKNLGESMHLKVLVSEKKEGKKPNKQTAQTNDYQFTCNLFGEKQLDSSLPPKFYFLVTQIESQLIWDINCEREEAG